MHDYHKKKKFLNFPRYAGGSEAFRAFISQNLRYPQAAVDAKIEGRVVIEYEIDDDGFVHNPRVLKGLGYGCDEEALRLVTLLRFEKVKNRGMRVKVTTKTNINFILRQATPSISYTIVTKPATDSVSQKSQPSKTTPVIYNYTVNL